MAKKLLIIRHAKSDWADINLSDFDRPLNKRGKKNAPEMAKRLVKRGLFPKQLVSSPALRAMTTAEYFAKELGIKKSEILKDPEIYEALTQSLLDTINHLDDRSDLTALFGHNPGITQLVNDLCNSNIYNIPTCGMALIRFPFDHWEMVSRGTGELIFFDYPRNEED